MNQAEILKSWRSKKEGGLPLSPEPATRDLRRVFSGPRVLAVSSGKGGVGKTSVVTNVAIAMAARGKRVMIIDADLGLANVDVMLGLVPRYTIKDVFSGERTLREILVEGPKGISILPAASGITDLVNLDESEKLFLLGEIEEFVDSIDYLLIDNAAGISDNVLYFAMAAQERVVVVTPEPTSITDAYALVKVLWTRHRVRSFSILVNQAKDHREAVSVFRQLSTAAGRFLEHVSLDYLGHVRRDDAVSMAIRRQRSVIDTYPASDAGRDLVDISDAILNKEDGGDADGNIKFFWRHLVRVS